MKKVINKNLGFIISKSGNKKDCDMGIVGLPIDSVWDVDETETIDAMSDEHFADFVKFIKLSTAATRPQ